MDRALLDVAEARLNETSSVVGAAGPAWMDAERLVYADLRSGSSVLRLIRRDGRAAEELVPGTLPVPDPRGDVIAFIAAEERLSLLDLGDRSVTQTSAKPMSMLGGTPFAWSPDGERLASVEFGRFGTRVLVLDRLGKELHSVWLEGFADSVSWLDEERLVALTFGGEDDPSSLVVVPSREGEPRTLATNLGLVLHPEVWPVAGGRAVRVLRNPLEPDVALYTYHYDLIEVDVDTGDTRVVVDAEQWVFSNVALLAEPETGEPVVLTRRSGIQYVLRTMAGPHDVVRERAFPLQFVHGLRQSPDGRHVAWVGEDLDDRAVLRVARLAGAGPIEPVDLVTLRDERPEEIPLADVAAFEWTTRDGVELGGLVFTPARAGAGAPLPLWVDVHGGPEGGINSDGSLLLSTVLEWHHRAALGFVVFVADYRSSGVAGLEARRSAKRPLVVTEMHDVFDGIDALAASHPFDAERIVILGHSAGGAPAQYALANADRALAVVIVKESGLGLTEERGDAFVYWFGEGEEGVRRYEASDPVRNAERITTPALLLAGDVPDDGSAQEMRPLFDALSAKSKAPVRFASYPNEGHVFMRRETLEAVLEDVDRFLRQDAGVLERE